MQYTLEEAIEQRQLDIYWLIEAGFINPVTWRRNDEVYHLFMSGQLTLPPEVEINILRRLERLESLHGQIEGYEQRGKKSKIRA
jgi:hypothetical protein